MPLFHIGQSVNNPFANNGYPQNSFPPSNGNFIQPRQSFSNNFGAPPRNLDFNIDGLPPDMQPNGLSQSLPNGQSFNNVLNDGTQIRVKKVYHVQKSDDLPEDPTKIVTPLPPTPPPCNCENCLNKKSQSLTRHSRHSFVHKNVPRQHSKPHRRLPQNNDEGCDCHACIPRKFCNCVDCSNSGIQKSVQTHHPKAPRKLPQHEDEECDCHACSPRKFCKCIDCLNSGHDVNCTCFECRPDIHKKKTIPIVHGKNNPRNDRSRHSMRDNTVNNHDNRHIRHDRGGKHQTDWLDDDNSSIPLAETPVDNMININNQYSRSYEPPLKNLNNPYRRSNGSIFNAHLKNSPRKQVNRDKNLDDFYRIKDKADRNKKKIRDDDTWSIQTEETDRELLRFLMN